MIIILREEEVSADDCDEWVSLAVSVTLEIAAFYWMRMVKPLSEWPYKLFFLIQQPAKVECDLRKAISHELLVTDDDDIIDKGFTAKFRVAFNAELFDSSQTGLLDEFIFSLLTDIANHWGLDTQNIEGINGMLKRILTLAPNISLPLMSARVCVAKNISTALNHPSSRSEIAQQAVEYHRDSLRMQGT